MDPRKGASEATVVANRAVFEKLPFEDERDFEEASRGFIAPLADGPVTGEDGTFVFDPERLAFTRGREDAPETVNPSLWRQARLVAEGGLFEVCDRIYQVRGYDISNLTVIEGDTGVIVVDPLISAETARAALDLYFEHRPVRPVVAVIHSHSHIDHYGGVRGVVDESDVAAGRVKIVAPEGFLEAAISENVFAGNAMTRRAMYQFGPLLAPDDKGTVGVGLGTGVSLGTVTLIPPTDEITEDGQRMVIDGLTFEFMPTPDTEAPAEMHWYIEELRALTAAENCVHTLHNTYPIRGAQVRDPAGLVDVPERDDRAMGSEVRSHVRHAPLAVMGPRAHRRDAEQGPRRLPLHQRRDPAAGQPRPYRRSRSPSRSGCPPRSNATGRSATTTERSATTSRRPTRVTSAGSTEIRRRSHALPPVVAAEKYVEFMGGAEAVIERAGECQSRGEYRWVAEVMRHVVFADPANREARELAADAMEQLGYQAESSTWRNAYLTGAQELRYGTPSLPPLVESGSPDTMLALTLPMLFNYMGVRLNGPDAGEREITVNLEFTDTHETAWLRLESGSLNHSVGRLVPDADTTVKLERSLLHRVVAGEFDISEKVEVGAVVGDPDAAPLVEIFELLDDFNPWFGLIEP